MQIIDNFLERSEFSDYEDFKSNFKLIIPDGFDFARDVVDKWAEIEPGKRALVYYNDEGEERTFTFNDISTISKKIAGYLTSIGIKAGDRVMTLLRRRWEYWATVVALHRIGAVVVPVSIQMETKDLVYRCNECKAKLIIAIDDEFVLTQIGGIKSSCELLENVAIVGNNIPNGDLDFNNGYKDSEEFLGYSNLKNSDEMLIYFTSGTTGYPKQVIHNRTYPLGHILTAKYLHQVVNNGLHITQADSGWAKFGWGNIYGQWICGTAMLAYDPKRFTSAGFIAVLNKFKPNTMCLPPTMYRMLMRDGLKKEDVEFIDCFVSAGEMLSAEVNCAFRAISGKFIREGFGQSEGTPIFANWKWVDVIPCSMGKRSPLYDTVIMKDGELCNVGDCGEIVIRTKGNDIGLLTSYRYDGKNHNPFKNDEYHTGDEAYIDVNGYGWYLGRNDDIIKSSGYRIGPYEIESILNTHKAVKESAIIGVPDEIRGQRICAVIVLNKGFEPSQELTLELQNYVKSNTAPYKYPREIRYIDAIPKTTSGKIIRKALKSVQ